MRGKLNERLKELRRKLGLSQEYVSRILGVNRTSIVAIEADKREVKAEELRMFSELYGISMDELMYGRDKKVKVFAIAFSELSDIDKKEVLNLAAFKNKIKKETMLEN